MPDSLPKNMIGPKVKATREALGWTQEKLALRCQLVGFDASRATIAQIESQYRKVSDIEFALIARALRVKLQDLAPRKYPTWTIRPHGR